MLWFKKFKEIVNWGRFRRVLLISNLLYIGAYLLSGSSLFPHQILSYWPSIIFLPLTLFFFNLFTGLPVAMLFSTSGKIRLVTLIVFVCLSVIPLSTSITAYSHLNTNIKVDVFCEDKWEVECNGRRIVEENNLWNNCSFVPEERDFGRLENGYYYDCVEKVKSIRNDLYIDHSTLKDRFLVNSELSLSMLKFAYVGFIPLAGP